MVPENRASSPHPLAMESWHFDFVYIRCKSVPILKCKLRAQALNDSIFISWHKVLFLADNSRCQGCEKQSCCYCLRRIHEAMPLDIDLWQVIRFVRHLWNNNNHRLHCYPSWCHNNAPLQKMKSFHSQHTWWRQIRIATLTLCAFLLLCFSALYAPCAAHKQKNSENVSSLLFCIWTGNALQNIWMTERRDSKQKCTRFLCGVRTSTMPMTTTVLLWCSPS